MDLEQTVQELRTRIARLRTQLELNNTVDELEPKPKQPSAADAYKARLMKKHSS